MNRAPVPETPIDKDGHLFCWENKIRLTPQIRFGPTMHTVPKTQSMYCRSESDLAACVMARLSLHSCTDGLIRCLRVSVYPWHFAAGYTTSFKLPISRRIAFVRALATELRSWSRLV